MKEQNKTAGPWGLGGEGKKKPLRLMHHPAIPQTLITPIFGFSAYIRHLTASHKNLNNGGPQGVSIRFLCCGAKINDSRLNIFCAKEDFGDL